ncbi:aryl-alcohol-oxidase from pleurotus Eryingii [Collybia nuda]|uniref:Aryl-alcohol-oxidase from pleurotus Eryingii n=1 Tax=Collybia nuda TaxID=64659 RepID=A0A9P5Y0B0_9AGAR|nr:aryl-alcohol-oxidase from pleurotus Eryingii [Collybia nuda]
MITSTLQWVVASALVLPALGKIYNNPTELTKTTYDYIVVGAGAAGAVVAARLSEDKKISVLLVEAGISDQGIVPLTVPFLGPSLSPGTPFDWNFTTTNQAGYLNRTIPYPRGKILGGSTSINFMAYMHGSIGDFDRYASVTGDSGWNWNNMQKYIKKNEKLVPPADHHDTTGELIPSLHSTTGALSVSLSGSPSPLDARVIATTKELSNEFPFNPDGVGGNVLGIGYNFATIGNGTRCSSVTGYLTPAFGRSNLDIVLNAQATKLLVTGKVKGLPSFKSVLVTEKEGAPVRTLTAKNEMVLSAGVFGTAMLLQHSGIGDRDELRAAGVATVVHNPSVGKNMSDHALLANMWSVNNSNSFDAIFRNPNLFNADMNQWATNKTGPMTGTVANNIGWFRLPKTASIFKKTPDPAAGPKSSHYEMIFSNLWVDPIIPAPATGNFMSITTALISPTSRGSIKIMSSNAFAKPLLNPNFMTTDFDIFTMVEAVKAAKRFLAAKAWKGYVLGPAGDLKTANTDDEIATYVRGHAATVWHAAGTAMMSAKNANYGVVDPDLKVKGVDGLRIVDGSILPFVPNAHTQGPIYLIAERGADLIKQDCH